MQFSAPYNNKVKTRRVHPSGTGYIDRLYAVEGFPAGASYEVERSFLSPVDSRAASAVNSMLRGNSLNIAQRQALSGFIMTLIMRMPREIEILKGLVRTLNTTVAGALFDFIKRHVPEEHHGAINEAVDSLKDSFISRSVKTIVDMMSLSEGVDKFSTMKYQIINLDSSPFELLTSDKPVIIAGGELNSGDTLIMLPISPRRLFVSSTEEGLIKKMLTVGDKKIVESVNREVVIGADKFVYSRTDLQLRFVQNHFGRNRGMSIIEKTLTESALHTDALVSYLSGLSDDNLRREITRVISETGENSQEAGALRAAFSKAILNNVNV